MCLSLNVEKIKVYLKVVLDYVCVVVQIKVNFLAYILLLLCSFFIFFTIDFTFSFIRSVRPGVKVSTTHHFGEPEYLSSMEEEMRWITSCWIGGIENHLQ